MDIKAFIHEIELGKAAPIALFYGLESFLLEEAIRQIEERFVPFELRDFNLIRYDLSETPLETVIEEAETYPFLGEHKVIIVRDARIFTAMKEHNKVEHRLEALIDYLENPAAYSILLFCIEHEKLDERKKIVKRLKEKGKVISFQPLIEQDLQNWIKDQVLLLHVSIDPDAARLFIEKAGFSLHKLSQEIEKLAIYCGHGGTITKELVRTMITRTLEDNIFALTERVSKMKIDEALVILNDLFTQKEEPIKILMLLARQFRLMLQSKILHSKGYGQQQIASTLGSHPYPIKLALEGAQSFSISRLQAIMAELANLDYAMKTGQAEKELGLELFILQLAEK